MCYSEKLNPVDTEGKQITHNKLAGGGYDYMKNHALYYFSFSVQGLNVRHRKEQNEQSATEK